MPLSSENINNTFFEGSYKYAWKGTIPAGLTEAEVDFIQEIAVLKKGSKVLDIMCGYGRHALELGKRGIQVTAIDNLKEYIDEIELNASEQELPVNAIQADVLQAKITDVYDAVICMGNSFAFFDKQDAITILKNISAHLKPGGVLIINSWMIAEVAIKHFRERDWHYAGEYKCMLEYKYRFHPSRIESEQTIIAPDGAVEMVKGIDYIFTLDELEQMFNEAGLKTKDVYSTPRKKRFIIGDGRAYIVISKIA
jgi:2-polyprenyl-3-methyl-5-hydroxy-6-metoxy-1,4-benzoquinol methylase